MTNMGDPETKPAKVIGFSLYIESGQSQHRLFKMFAAAKSLGIFVENMDLINQFERPQGTMRTWNVKFRAPEPIDYTEKMRMIRVICPEEVPHGFYD